ncbi:Hypothetical predicted protein [Mytilus galloprovincialis]|uniref:Mab-21-like HhH/H2TH-like domain-containing protein n=2 Tax=Mytilus galloprovincialis TaxID=29158 RepID=A0A8B6C2F4_MYTGA|nr:Hypothetical predicted protein [Mytilus galloprovincialis]
MADNSTSDMSICLYNYLCHNIVGSAEYVRLIRLINASTDRIKSNTFPDTYITSGSFGEGLELNGSDCDIMILPRYNDIVVTDQTKLQVCHSSRSVVLLETNDVKPGFAYLRVIKGNTKNSDVFCRGAQGQEYLSSVMFKMCILNERQPIIHGPCASDREGAFDLAFSLHSKSWIFTALKWVTRSNNSWPTSEVKQRVIDHGVICVPIGQKGDLNEELKWRISFSLGEKFLIYTFRHTQLLCYALMKMFLKNVISESPGCNDLLCSYFIKTILFWLSEELPTSVWKPDNLILCFTKCFKRLIYCVEYSVCPHYFIPENNLFENKIIGHSRTKLLQKLNEFHDYGWQDIFSSEQISSLPYFTRDQCNADMFANNIEKIIKSKTMAPVVGTTIVEYERCLKSILLSKSKRIRTIHLHNMTRLSLNNAHTMQLSNPNSNKYKYKQYKTCICYILQSTQQDAVLGWLMLATLFYKHKQYYKALCVLSYSLTKCTTEKLSFGANITDVHRNLLRNKIFRKLKIIRTLRFLMLLPYLTDFGEKNNSIPDELNMNDTNDFNPCIVIPPVTYLHFLTFLCHFRLHNIRNYQESLGDLRLTIEEDYFISDIVMKAVAYDCLGVAFHIIGDTEAAREAFVKSTEIFPDQFMNHSFKRLAVPK